MKNKKSKGRELLQYIQDGYYICNECDAIMDLRGDILVCPDCDYQVKHDDYSYDDYEEYYEEFDEDIPYGCSSCGGPYPYCKTSCKLFDD